MHRNRDSSVPPGDGYIGFEEFVVAMALFMRGSEEEKLQCMYENARVEKVERCSVSIFVVYHWKLTALKFGYNPFPSYVLIGRANW